MMKVKLLTLKRPLVLCQKCGGCGKSPLDDALWETLRGVHNLGEATAEQLSEASHDDIGVTAWNNRLEKLRSIGHVKRFRRGKFWVYSKF